MTRDEFKELCSGEDEALYRQGIELLLSCKEGRAVIWRLIYDSGIWHTSVFSENPQIMAYASGYQKFSLEFMHRLNDINPMAWAKIQQEAVLLERSRKEKLESLEESENG